MYSLQNYIFCSTVKENLRVLLPHFIVADRFRSDIFKQAVMYAENGRRFPGDAGRKIEINQWPQSEAGYIGRNDKCLMATSFIQENTLENLVFFNWAAIPQTFVIKKKADSTLFNNYNLFLFF